VEHGVVAQASAASTVAVVMPHDARPLRRRYRFELTRRHVHPDDLPEDGNALVGMRWAAGVTLALCVVLLCAFRC
jgi:hypothetical protein